MNYAIIMPVYDEEAYVGRAIESILRQSHLPDRLVIVDDGSLDSTNSIIQKYTKQYPWIQMIRNSVRAERAIGAKVVEAFNMGYNILQEEYSLIVKMDADISLPAHYFETIEGHFQQNPKLGIVGGRMMIERDHVWIEDYTSDRDHVKGPCKTYRVDCFRDIGGLAASVGWDTADELLARYHGWQILVDPDLEVRHHRKMGSLTGGLKVFRLIGHGIYRLRYGFFLTCTSALKAGLLNRPYGVTGVMLLWGWIQSAVARDPFLLGVEEGRFVREFRLKRIVQKIRRWGKIQT